jgi:hypothetical protein
MGEYEVGMISNTPGSAQQHAFKGDFNTDPNLMPRNMKMTSVNDENLDPTILDKVRALNSAKLKAVE